MDWKYLVQNLTSYVIPKRDDDYISTLSSKP